MNDYLRKQKSRLSYRLISALICLSFVSNLVIPQQVLAQGALLGLPAPGSMVNVSPAFHPPLIIGLTVNPTNALKFDFLVDRGDANLQGDALKDESQRMIRYFFAALTIPEDQVWVNLSPYEKDKIAPEDLGNTDLGRDLLEQDYLLKQLTATLMFPEKELGKSFWDKVYKKAHELYGTTQVPVDTFNKVWIVPDRATVFEKQGTAFVVDSHLKVMLEEDYLALKHNMATEKNFQALDEQRAKQLNSASSPVVKEVLLPAIEEEINQGKNFAQLRQVYNAIILATWFKKTLHDSLLGKIYMDKGKILGVDVDDKTVKEQIYSQYLQAFKKGVFNYIKEDYDQYANAPVPRKYFSGGVIIAGLKANVEKTIVDNPDIPDIQEVPETAVPTVQHIADVSASGRVARVQAGLQAELPKPNDMATLPSGPRTMEFYTPSIRIKDSELNGKFRTEVFYDANASYQAGMKTFRIYKNGKQLKDKEVVVAPNDPEIAKFKGGGVTTIVVTSLDPQNPATYIVKQPGRQTYEARVERAKADRARELENGIVIERLHKPEDVARVQEDDPQNWEKTTTAFFRTMASLKNRYENGTAIFTYGPGDVASAEAMSRAASELGIDDFLEYNGGWWANAMAGLDDSGRMPDDTYTTKLPADSSTRLAQSEREQERQMALRSPEQRVGFRRTDFDTGQIIDIDLAGNGAKRRQVFREAIQKGIETLKVRFFHLEDQAPGTKVCGHLALKVLVALDEFIEGINDFQLEKDIMRVNVGTLIRTDAEGADFISGKRYKLDQPFILGATKSIVPFDDLIRKMTAEGISDETEILKRINDWKKQAGLMTMREALIKAVLDHGQYAMTGDEWVAFARKADHNADMVELEQKAEDLGIYDLYELTRTANFDQVKAKAQEYGIKFWTSKEWGVLEREKPERLQEGINLLWDEELPVLQDKNFTLWMYQSGTEAAAQRLAAVAPYGHMAWSEQKGLNAKQSEYWKKRVDEAMLKFAEKKFMPQMLEKFSISDQAAKKQALIGTLKQYQNREIDGRAALRQIRDLGFQKAESQLIINASRRNIATNTSPSFPLRERDPQTGRSKFSDKDLIDLQKRLARVSQVNFVTYLGGEINHVTAMDFMRVFQRAPLLTLAAFQSYAITEQIKKGLPPNAVVKGSQQWGGTDLSADKNASGRGRVFGSSRTVEGSSYTGKGFANLDNDPTLVSFEQLKAGLVDLETGRVMDRPIQEARPQAPVLISESNNAALSLNLLRRKGFVDAIQKDLGRPLSGDEVLAAQDYLANLLLDIAAKSPSDTIAESSYPRSAIISSPTVTTADIEGMAEAGVDILADLTRQHIMPTPQITERSVLPNPVKGPTDLATLPSAKGDGEESDLITRRVIERVNMYDEKGDRLGASYALADLRRIRDLPEKDRQWLREEAGLWADLSGRNLGPAYIQKVIAKAKKQFYAEYEERRRTGRPPTDFATLPEIRRDSKLGSLKKVYPDVYTPEALGGLQALSPINDEVSILRDIRSITQSERVRMGREVELRKKAGYYGTGDNFRREEYLRDKQKAKLHFPDPTRVIGGSGITGEEARLGDFFGSPISEKMETQFIQLTGPAVKPKDDNLINPAWKAEDLENISEPQLVETAFKILDRVDAGENLTKIKPQSIVEWAALGVIGDLRNVAHQRYSGADSVMEDLEDAAGQRSTMSLDNIRSLNLSTTNSPLFMRVARMVMGEYKKEGILTIDGQIKPKGDLTDREWNDWKHQLDFTLQIVRARGLHLDDRHVQTPDGKFMAASIADSVLFWVNNYRSYLDKGLPMVQYLPKIQTAEQADLWNEIMQNLELYLMKLDKRAHVGMLKTYVLVEQHQAVFELPEIRAALSQGGSRADAVELMKQKGRFATEDEYQARLKQAQAWDADFKTRTGVDSRDTESRFIGFNTGRWDYINSVIDENSWDEEWIPPNIEAINMQWGFMAPYEKRVFQVVNIPDLRGIKAKWQGGMETQVPLGSPEAVTLGIAKATKGAERERDAGAEGKWAAHPRMVQDLRRVWEEKGKDYIRAIQAEATPPTYTQADEEALRVLDPNPQKSPVTVEGLRSLISVGMQMGNAHLRGLQAAALKPADYFEVPAVEEVDRNYKAGKYKSEEEYQTALSEAQVRHVLEAKQRGEFKDDASYQVALDSAMKKAKEQRLALFLMEDMATGEIRATTAWKWAHHGARFTQDDPAAGIKAGDAVTRDFVLKVIDEEYDKLQSASPKNVHAESKVATLPAVKYIMQQYISADQKMPWYIDLLNISLDQNPEQARASVDRYISTYRETGKRLTGNPLFTSDSKASQPAAPSDQATLPVTPTSLKSLLAQDARFIAPTVGVAKFIARPEAHNDFRFSYQDVYRVIDIMDQSAADQDSVLRHIYSQIYPSSAQGYRGGYDAWTKDIEKTATTGALFPGYVNGYYLQVEKDGPWYMVGKYGAAGTEKLAVMNLNTMQLVQNDIDFMSTEGWKVGIEGNTITVAPLSAGPSNSDRKRTVTLPAAAKTSDFATLPPAQTGGINLSSDYLNLEIRRDENGIPLPIEAPNLENMNINGFIPVIINITPAINLPLFLGSSDGKQESEKISLSRN